MFGAEANAEIRQMYLNELGTDGVVADALVSEMGAVPLLLISQSSLGQGAAACTQRGLWHQHEKKVEVLNMTWESSQHNSFGYHRCSADAFGLVTGSEGPYLRLFRSAFGGVVDTEVYDEIVVEWGGCEEYPSLDSAFVMNIEVPRALSFETV